MTEKWLTVKILCQQIIRFLCNKITHNDFQCIHLCLRYRVKNLPVLVGFHSIGKFFHSQVPLGLQMQIIPRSITYFAEHSFWPNISIATNRKINRLFFFRSFERQKPINLMLVLFCFCGYRVVPHRNLSTIDS